MLKNQKKKKMVGSLCAALALCLFCRKKHFRLVLTAKGKDKAGLLYFEIGVDIGKRRICGCFVFVVSGSPKKNVL